jgi:hypothetical protein
MIERCSKLCSITINGGTFCMKNINVKDKIMDAAINLIGECVSLENVLV